MDAFTMNKYNFKAGDDCPRRCGKQLKIDAKWAETYGNVFCSNCSFEISEDGSSFIIYYKFHLFERLHNGIYLITSREDASSRFFVKFDPYISNEKLDKLLLLLL